MSNKLDSSAEWSKKMVDTLQHRGPDDSGIYQNGCIALGHRRLAIIDLSPGGHQPMSGPAGSTWLVYNGEIYNYLELRADLESLGHRFKSQSDTEIILHAYQEFGPNCLQYFNGMFALALWDEAKQQLFLARDRFGIKPLYLFHSAHQLIFASEIKAILAVLDHVPQPNHRLLYDFLTVGALDHTDQTFFRDIDKLPAAHYALVYADGQIQLEQYWDFEVNNEIASLSDRVLEEKSAAFFELLTNAVRVRLISDVPVGSCLSGGLDSSTIVSVISQTINENKVKSVGPQQQTFSACYDDHRIDEQPYIDEVIRWSGAISHRVFPDAQGFRAVLPQLIWHQEEPFGSSSIYAQWLVMQRAKEQNVTVLLDGQGADEQLLGYRKFYAFYVSSLLRGGRLGLAVEELIRHFGSWDVLRTLQLRRGFRYFQNRRLNSATLSRQLLQEIFARRFADNALQLGISDDLGQRIKADMTRFSIPVLLRYEDKNSMAFSREARVPFLDHRLVEFVAGLPLNLKLRDGWTKYCLRRGARGKVPEKILSRKDKLGFATPEDDWFRNDLVSEVQHTFSQAAFLPEFVKTSKLTEQFEAYVQGKQLLLGSEFFFRYFILEHWARCFILN